MEYRNSYVLDSLLNINVLFMFRKISLLQVCLYMNNNYMYDITNIKLR